MGYGVPGVVLTPREDARIFDGLRRAIADRLGRGIQQHYVAPPVIARSIVERVGYPLSFPHLLGWVHQAVDGERTKLSDVVLTPAACHHLYPLLADRVLKSPTTISVEGDCYRGEATFEPGRLRSFRMYEIVYLGVAEEVTNWRDSLLDAARAWLADIGLHSDIVPASDPFFGRGGKLMASAQRTQQLKYELTMDVADGVVQAVGSANCHRDHFGKVFDIRGGDGLVAHSACLAFGLDRLVLALRHRHGTQTEQWPRGIRENLSVSV
ncbi:hypothetical protein ABZT02_41095 [Streptomyces sp. NPDC005402]|uniref:hypothetical protein n=1 Tax=Streptomyces sp. NPDC005402 TaxID=3155338 RepID=UPI0033BBE021